MEHNTVDVRKVLDTRAEEYGSYIVGVHNRAKIMQALNTIHKDRHGAALPADVSVIFSDIILKLMRLAANPEHRDSWVDLAGYATLAKEAKVKQC